MPSRRDALRAFAMGATAGLAGCSSLRGGPNEVSPESVGTDWSPPPRSWVGPGRDPRNSNAVEAPGPTAGAVVAAFPDTTPEYDTRRYLVAATPETAYLLDADERSDGTVVRALETDDWTERWHYRFAGDATVGAAGLVDGTLFFTREGRVRTLDATTGEERWRTDLYARLAEAVGDRFLPDREGFDGPRLVPTPGTLYAVSGYGFHGLSPTDGTERWRVAWPVTRTGLVRDIAVATDAVWTLDGTGDLFGLSADGLRELDLEPSGLLGAIATSTGGPLVTDVAGEAFSLAGVPPDARVLADTEGSVATRWTLHAFPDVAGVHETSGPAIANGLAAVSAVVEPDDREEQRAVVLALDTDSGAERWRHRLPTATALASTADMNAALSAPVLAGDSVYVGVGPRRRVADDAWLVNPPGTVLELDAETGRVRRQMAPDVPPRGLAVAGRHCFVSDFDGSLAVLG